MDKDLILMCRKCNHRLYVGSNTIEELYEKIDNLIYDEEGCPNCGEEGYENWVLIGLGSYEEDYGK